jgi:hypothetical protein
VDCSAVLGHVQRGLGVEMVAGSMVSKRRTVSGRTLRGTWLRVECRSRQRVVVQGWGGVEAAAALIGVAKPDWYRSISWRDPVHEVWWRADETQLVAEPTVAAAGPLVADPGLDQQWWGALSGSMSALAAQPTGQFAKLDSATASQEHLSVLVNRSARLLGTGGLDSQVTEWTTAHADLTWANLTAPRCWLLDWEDWGRAPRGFDAATMLLYSLSIPTLADQVRATFASDLATRSARIAILARAADLLSYPDAAGPLLEPARREAWRAAEALSR